ncbi:MAG: chitosanase [Sphingobacteriales bacterium]
MKKCIVTVPKLNKRSSVPASFSDKSSITGFVLKGFVFEGKDAPVVNPDLGKWYFDRDNNFYWSGGLNVLDETELADLPTSIDNTELENFAITPSVKKKIEQVINAFESGSAQGNYAELVKYKDHREPSGIKTVQVTYGRSQTTEFGHLKALIQDYVNQDGKFADSLKPYVEKIGKKPSLATDDTFCDTLKKAGKEDIIMRSCQDNFFENKYYLPAHNWYSINGFALPLSMLVIYDSYIHSGGILSFLRKKFTAIVPASGGDEKKWIDSYVKARHNWLSNHGDPLLQHTAYRTRCLLAQLEHNNWELAQKIIANGVVIN